MMKNDWGSSPCSSCTDSPCCTRLPLYKTRVETLRDLDALRYVLDFDRIQVGLYDTGTWIIYYHRECGSLDPNTGKCRIHGKPEQPAICRIYSPVDCFYREAFTADGNRRFLRLNGERLRLIRTLITADEPGEITDTPEWEDLAAEVRRIPVNTPPSPLRRIDAADPTHDSAGGIEFGTPGAEGPSIEECRSLYFPVIGSVIPGTGLEFDRFRLGFPGISLAEASEPERPEARHDTSAFIRVETECAFLENGLCSMYPFPCSRYRTTGGEPIPYSYSWFLLRSGSRVPRSRCDRAGRIC